MRVRGLLNLRIAVCAGLLLLGCTRISADGESVDGERALQHAADILKFGPHPPGSKAQLEVGAYLIGQLKALGLEVKTDAFTASTPEGPLQMVNIWGVLPGTSQDVVILASHYDTKLFRDFEFLGANDPAASAALVLELARVLTAHNPSSLTLWFVFFDGEEALRYWTASDSLYGSRRFVRMLQNSGESRDVKAMILLDLIGGDPLHIYKETHSTPWLNEILWRKAMELGHSSVFVPPVSAQSGRTDHGIAQTTVEDDHIPFLNAGIPAADLIDLSYAHWHKPSDTLDKLSSDNLQLVGEVVREALPEISRHLQQP